MRHLLIALLAALLLTAPAHAIEPVEGNPDHLPSITIGGYSTTHELDADLGEAADTEYSTSSFFCRLKIPVSSKLTIWGSLEKEAGTQEAPGISYNLDQMRVGAGITIYLGSKRD